MAWDCQYHSYAIQGAHQLGATSDAELGSIMPKIETFSAASFVGNNFSRYAYMCEVNPWTPDKVLHDATLYRGAILSAWGFVETTLIELTIRASQMSQYSGLSKKYPYRLNGRIKYMRKVLDCDGPFSEYRVLGHLFLDRFEKAADLRHILAHAKMQVLSEITFIDYSPGQGGMITFRYNRFTISELEKMARKATRLSRLMQMGYAAINGMGFLPPLRRK